MRLTVRHYYNFGAQTGIVGGDLTSEVAWDRLRLDSSLDGFALPRVRSAWLELCEGDREARRRAEHVARVVSDGAHTSVISIGVGRAHLEYWLKRLRPDVRLTCLDYAQRTVEVLQGLFQECDAVETFDLRVARWPAADGKALYLCCRVDTELSDAEWVQVFRRMADAGVRRVLFVPSGFLDGRTAAREAVGRLRSLLSGRHSTFAGYLRTKAAFRQLWSASFVSIRQLAVGDQQAFLLERRVHSPDSAVS